jgi:hypothetical protein
MIDNDMRAVVFADEIAQIDRQLKTGRFQSEEYLFAIALRNYYVKRLAYIKAVAENV